MTKPNQDHALSVTTAHSEVATLESAQQASTKTRQEKPPAKSAPKANTVLWLASQQQTRRANLASTAFLVQSLRNPTTFHQVEYARKVTIV